jgi:catechol 2,3-dioxygenase-like lactoylglutathione lyase family enzyme
MITGVSLQTVWVRDIDESRDFFVDKLGFVLNTDVTMGDYRWCTVNHPDQPELQITFSIPDVMMDAEDAAQVNRMLAKGAMSGGGLRVDDCRKTYDELTAKGVQFVSEPAERPYGVEAVMRDNSGNWWVLVEPRQYTQEDLETGGSGADA